MPKLTIDGKEIEVADGLNLIQAAEHIGVEIPHYCYHPALTIVGNCRMCLVEVEKAPKLQIACNTRVTEGMVVHTQSARTKAAQKAVLEFLLINHPIDCPVCDQAGECKLQDYYMEYDRRPRASRCAKEGPQGQGDSTIGSRCDARSGALRAVRALHALLRRGHAYQRTGDLRARRP